MHGGAMSLVGRSDAAYGGLCKEGGRRPGYVIGLMSPCLSGPSRVSSWTSKFTRKLVRSCLDGEVYAPSEMVGHMVLLRGFYSPLANLPPGTLGMGDCESLFARLKTEKLVRHLLISRQVIAHNELGYASWLSGLENPAHGTTKAKRDMIPLLRLLGSGAFHPGLSRPLQGGPCTAGAEG